MVHMVSVDVTCAHSQGHFGIIATDSQFMQAVSQCASSISVPLSGALLETCWADRNRALLPCFLSSTSRLNLCALGEKVSARFSCLGGK